MMNALMEPICVIKCVPTLLDPTSVPVIVDMNWDWIKGLVLVSIIQLYTYIYNYTHLEYINFGGIYLAVYIWRHAFGGIHWAYISHCANYLQ